MSLSFQAHEHERTRLGVSPELGLGMCGETPRRTAYTPSKPPPLGGGRRVVCGAGSCRRRMRVACGRRQIEVRVTTANAGQAGTLVTAAMAGMPIAHSV
jgi:hypothetical protein